MITALPTRTLRFATVAILFLSARMVLAQGAPISGTAHLQLAPASMSVAIGGMASIGVAVDLSSVTGQGPSGPTAAVLGGYQIVVTFDPTRLQFTAASGGNPPFNSAPTFTNPSSANSSGMVTIVGSQTSSSSPTGTITVANLSFTALSGGSAAVSASATSLSSAFQPPSSGPASIPSTGAATNLALIGVPGSVSLPTPPDRAANVSAPVTLRWVAASNATSYDVFFGSGAIPIYIGSTPATSFSVAVSSGTSYQWRVVARNAAGSTSGPLWSFITSGPAPCAVPAAPQLTAPSDAPSGTTYTLSWITVSNASDYILEESVDGTFAATTQTTIPAPGTSSAVMKSVTIDTTFYYRMLARNTAAGCLTSGPYSQAVSVVVHAPVVTLPPPPKRLVIPVAGSLAGSFGSSFKTALQLTNPTSQTISGRIVYHPAGVSGSDSDPSLSYQLAPGETHFYADLLPQLGLTGLGSADLITTDSIPVSVIRIFNDGGDRGTTGMTVDLVQQQDALAAGDATILVAPADPSFFRFNIGIRTLDNPVTLTISVRNRQGATVKTLTKNYAQQFFVQTSDADFIGSPASLSSSDTLTITIVSGSAIVYGATTDNRTQDPSLQLGRRLPK